LARKEKKVKGKKSQSKVESVKGVRRKTCPKSKRFHCNEFGHYATKCPHKKERKKTTIGIAGEASDS